MKRILFFLAFPAALLAGIVIWGVLQVREAATLEKIESAKITENFQTPQTETLESGEKQISFENVSFSYDTSLFSGVKGTLVSASPLEDPTAKPDGVYSKHINFIFENLYTGAKFTDESYYSRPRIHIYPIEEYKQAYLFYEINLEKDFDNLKKITRSNFKTPSASGSKELPYIPFADASQAFYGKAKVLKFQTGKGLLFLTQWQQDYVLINNSRLRYVFQGLTNDDKYFVFIEFPVSIKYLPQNDDARYADKYEQLNDYSSFNDEKYKRLYEKYALETALKLDKTPSEEFAPNLSKIENLIRSLNVK